MHVHAVIVSVHEGAHYMYTHGGRTEERRWESPLQGVAGGQHAKKSRNQDTQEQEHAANTDLAMLLIRSHAAVPVDVSSTAHCWFGTSSGTCCTAQCPAPLQSVSPILATKNDFPEGPVANQNCRARVGSGEDSKCCASATCPSGRSTRREHSVCQLLQ